MRVHSSLPWWRCSNTTLTDFGTTFIRQNVQYFELKQRTQKAKTLFPVGIKTYLLTQNSPFQNNIY